jgi:hypothetical protein
MALIPIAIAVLVAYQVVTYVVGLRQRINEAKRSGLPYIVTRAFTYTYSRVKLTQLFELC